MIAQVGGLEQMGRIQTCCSDVTSVVGGKKRRKTAGTRTCPRKKTQQLHAGLLWRREGTTQHQKSHQKMERDVK